MDAENNIVLEKQKDATADEKSAEQSSLENTYKGLIDALKTITMSTIVDEETMEDFFSDYEKYEYICSKLSKFKLLPSDIPSTKVEFSLNPVQKWVDIISIIFVSLYAMPNNGNVYCEKIVYKNNGDGDNVDVNGVGVFFSVCVTMEVAGWDDYRIDLFLPMEKSESKTLFIINGKLVLFC